MFLIYPYWNVNAYNGEDGYDGYVSFLIYPYWNVNDCKIIKLEKNYRVSNLSILECK